MASVTLLHSKKSLQSWLADYAVSHQHPINKKIHWLCVPTIFASILGMGMSWQAAFTLVLIALVMLFQGNRTIKTYQTTTVREKTYFAKPAFYNV